MDLVAVIKQFSDALYHFRFGRRHTPAVDPMFRMKPVPVLLISGATNLLVINVHKIF